MKDSFRDAMDLAFEEFDGELRDDLDVHIRSYDPGVCMIEVSYGWQTGDEGPVSFLFSGVVDDLLDTYEVMPNDADAEYKSTWCDQIASELERQAARIRKHALKLKNNITKPCSNPPSKN